MLIRYYGNITGESGYADAACEFCMSLITAWPEVTLEISCSAGQLPDRYLPLASYVRDRPALSPKPDVIIVHTLPLSCADVLRKEALEDCGARRIAYTTWEGAGAISHAVAKAMAAFDEVWVPSHTNHLDFQEMVDTAVRVVPHAFGPESVGASTSARPVAGPFSFYFIGSWLARKNVDGLIRAYLRAFMGTEDNVQLIIHSAGAPDSVVREAAVKATGMDPAELPAIRFSNQRADWRVLRDLHIGSECYVTATRGEAWNLPAFHAMLAGNHVIAPGGMGHDDFLRNTTAEIYQASWAPSHGDLRITEFVDGGMARAQYIAPQGMTCKDDWLDPDLNELARLMRHAYRNWTATLTCKYDPAERYGRLAVGKLIRDLLQNPPPRAEAP